VAELSIEKLQQEIVDLAARRDISDAVQRYMRGLDRLDRDMQRSAFHDNAEIDCGLMAGKVDAFVDFCQEFLGSMDGSHHLLGQVRIELDGDRARGECYFQAWHGTRGSDGEPRDLVIAGRYIDDYRCIDGDWRISRRVLLTDWVTDLPADHSFFENSPGALRGGRRGEDYSQRPR
jgi:hypothetical protein